MGGSSFALPLSVNEAGVPSVQATPNGTDGPGRLDSACSSWGGAHMGCGGENGMPGGSEVWNSTGSMPLESEGRAAGSECSDCV